MGGNEAFARRMQSRPWTDGRAVGFIPTTFWHRDETANRANEREQLFFQDFGLRDPAPRVKAFKPEITPADIYDVVHATGPFWARRLLPSFIRFFQYQVVPKEAIEEAIQILLNCGFTLAPNFRMPTSRRRKTASAQDRRRA